MIAWHITVPKPLDARTDALFQDTNSLSQLTDGISVNWYPYRKPGAKLLLRRLYGFQRIPELLYLDQKVTAHHIFNADLFPFPILRLLKKPILYTVTAGLQASSPKHRIKAQTIVVSSERESETLRQWGYENSKIIKPGIDLSSFPTQQFPPLPFKLLVGSAPWSIEQFKTKGLDALFKVVSNQKNINLVLLWRGILKDELDERIKKADLSNRIEVIDRWVDVGALAANCHAAIVLAKESRLVKSYPHSLIEALSVGRPVIISDTIPMADFVQQNKLGIVVKQTNLDSLTNAIKHLASSWAEFQPENLSSHVEDFTRESMVTHYAQLYKTIEQFAA